MRGKRPIKQWRPSNPILRFLHQHQIAIDQHDKGWWDLGFILYYAIFWTFARAFVIEYVFIPLARNSKCKSKLLQRFAEQAWLVLYYTLSFSCGFAIYVNSPYYLNTRHFWIGYPHILLKTLFKAYYLLQLSFWLQQLLVVFLEKPRKDHLQFVVHHVVTCTLLTTSYLGNFTRIGNAVLTLMDVADIFLSGAKCLNYLNWRKLCDIVFVIFVLVWVFSRHYLYFYLMYSVWNDMPILAPLRWDPATGFYASVGVGWFFLILFTVLQALLIFWFLLILNVVVKVARGTGVEDSRSDSEEDTEEDHSPRTEKHLTTSSFKNPTPEKLTDTAALNESNVSSKPLSPLKQKKYK